MRSRTFADIAEYAHSEVSISCPCCKAKATARVVDASFGPIGGSWITMPDGWAVASGELTPESITRGLVRCPACIPGRKQEQR